MIGSEWDIVSSNLSDSECESGCRPEDIDAIQCYRRESFAETACGTSGDFNLTEWTADFDQYETIEDCEASDCSRKAGVWCVNNNQYSALCVGGYYDSYENQDGWTFHPKESCVTKNCCLDENGDSIELMDVENRLSRFCHCYYRFEQWKQPRRRIAK